MKVCVTGAGGFVGGWLVKALVEQRNEVTAIDIKPFDQWWQCSNGAFNWQHDLRVAGLIPDDADYLFNLAADMGGMGYIETHKAECMLNVTINNNLLLAAKQAGVKRYFFASSACVYAQNKQSGGDWLRYKESFALKESDAYPAQPEDGYGWEKLFSERMCRHFHEDYGLRVRIARLHNVYGPHGTWSGGREKAPAAICRKVIEAKLSTYHDIEIWGDGNQVRSFMWIGDCIDGIQLIMNGDSNSPVNLGSAESVTINQLVDVAEEIAGIKLKRRYNLNAPRGVRGRSSDNTYIKQLFSWEPSTKLREGMEKLYAWVYHMMK